jgi:sugar/nucleoside kinase (ribokinase family)
LRIGIAAHIVLDTIKDCKGNITESMGGPPCYCGITARRFGFDVELLTKVGADFQNHHQNILRDSGITVRDWHFDKGAKTTRFLLEADGHDRRLSLKAKCSPITEGDVQNASVDCWLVNPVIDEVPASVLAAIKKNKGKKNFVMLDPQGYMRSASENGSILFADRLDIDLSGIDAIKVDQQELAALTGGLQDLEGMKFLQSKGLQFVLATERGYVHLLHEKMHYWIKLRDVDTPDSTGAGDILSAAFVCSYIKEKDPLWAVCFAAGALRAALETRKTGLDKIPPYPKIESSASYFYNTVGFEDLT